MEVTLEGDVPPMIRTAHGELGAPDPETPISSSEPGYATSGSDHFNPDRDTRRPRVNEYSDPFTPSTAPFKRLSAFDAIREDESLDVRDQREVPITIGGSPSPDDAVFYANIVVDLAVGARVRIPSVGSGTRVVRARLGVGARDLPFRMFRDGADNWFLQSIGLEAPVRARLILVLAIARAAFGGAFADRSWADLPPTLPLPERLARDAAVVREAIGVNRSMRPRDVVATLVQYFRTFDESGEPLPERGSVYLDLALSKRGVCRHRAFAFLVTAESLGIPTRLVTNEAHAWVEVHDGTLWRRVDLGGAGQLETHSESDAGRATYEPPPDPFRWPPGSKRGSDMLADARALAVDAAGHDPDQAFGASVARHAETRTADSRANAPPTSSSGVGEGAGTLLALEVIDSTAHRGFPLRVRGRASAGGDPCAHVSVEVVLREPKTTREFLLGTLATDDRGAFAGNLVVGGLTSLGDYDIAVRTPGDTRCAPGEN
ncbi:MAG: transglutaminase-like domain-containing protein [Polyangiaceae bacterium]|jgi:transglutaminase-like putative cysteine protease